MPVSSVRLSENIRRAVRASNYSVSELAREGIEQAIIGDLVSVCWICGEGIHRKERRDFITSEIFIDEIAHGEVGRGEWPLYQDEYHRFVEIERRGEVDKELYFKRVGQWLNLPERQPVELCSSCVEYLDQIREQKVRPVDLPIPYQYRVDGDREYAGRVEDVRPEPRHAYAAESAGVYLANYFSLQQVLFNKDHSEEHEVNGLFWWVARGRSNRIVGTAYHPWLEIALRSHAQTLRTGNPLQSIYKKALQTAIEIGKDWRPGGGGPPPNPDIHENSIPDGSDFCVACGTRLVPEPFGDPPYSGPRFERGGLSYCDACLFSYEKCHQGSECGLLHPRVRGEPLRQAQIELYCPHCGFSESAPEDYADALRTKYESVFGEIAMTVPMTGDSTNV